MIRVTFEFDTPEAAAEFLNGKSAPRARADKGTKRGPNARTKQRPPANTPAADKAPAPAQEEQHSAPPAVAPTQDEVTAAGKQVYDAKGLEAARALLRGFGANTMRDLKPEQWGAYIVQADNVVRGAYDPLAG